MLCKSPYMLGIMPCGCGQCLPCRVNRRRVWTHRLMLESYVHGDSSFVTLTYRNDEVHHYDDNWTGDMPVIGTLKPKDIQDWLKRLRKRVAPLAIRFFLAGEYGDQTWRPHYHVILFGYPPCQRLRTDNRLKFCCGSCELIKETWGKGRIEVGTVTMDSVQYCAGYVVKKLTQPDSWRNKEHRVSRGMLLNGRHPEFSRMSLKPGIGAHAMDTLVKALRTEVGQSYLGVQGDVPFILNHGQKVMPLGRYLRRKLREKLGRAADTPKSKFKEFGQQLRRLLEESLEITERKEAFDKQGVKGLFLEENRQKIINLEARSKIYSKTRSL